MSDSLHLVVTKPDGTTVDITGILTNTKIVESAPIVVPVPPVPQPPVLASDAVHIDALAMTTWKMNHDKGTPGSSSGTTSYPVTAPDGTPNCRLFDFTNSQGGGEIYHLNVLKDCTPYKNFCLKFRRMTPNPLRVTVSEHDLEACDASGKPLDMATQEDGYNHVFDVTENHKWVGTGIKVDPASWAPGSWHDDEIYLVDNKDGTVTYVGVTLDGVYYPLGITVADVDASTWTAKILNLQIQFDTRSDMSGEAKVYASQCEIIASR